ncbi:MAG: MFS transporter [Clostridia bacterium]|nr:MFS transporter [Clostridia bacterium]
MKLTYKHTVTACFIGYIVQAIINNFAPLLFLTFERDYGIPLGQIGILIGINFGVQLTTDFVAALIADKTGWRIPIITAHVLAAAGLIMMATLPEVMTNKFLALVISVVTYSIGGGLLEVLISPITEACPGEDKAAAMSILHSFYCWGVVGVVILSTLFFAVFGIDSWKILAFVWALIPIFNIFLFALVPFGKLEKDDEVRMPIGRLFKNKYFIIMIIIMFCSASCELSVSQWASAFVEKGLGVNKAVGDLAGPMMFAVLMGVARLIHAFLGDKIKWSLERMILYSSVLCLASYLIVSLSPLPWLSLIGCGICGFSVGILWPGTFSLASESIRGGGTAMFAILALFGDLGCGTGPMVVGTVASALGDNLNIGILVTAAAPLMLIGCLVIYITLKKSEKTKKSA